MARLVGLLAAAILLLQLLSLTQHHHDLKRHFSDCASCVIAAQLPAPGADPHITEQLLRLAVLQYVLPARITTVADLGTTKPIPRAQGPPAFSAV